MQCREAVERRDRLIEHLASLDPVPGALDQIVQHFGSDKVAEVTGRSRRIVAKVDGAGDTDASGAEVLGRLMERYPLQRIAEREGA